MWILDGQMCRIEFMQNVKQSDCRKTSNLYIRVTSIYTRLFFSSILNINLLCSTRGVWLAVTICGAIDRKSETAVLSHRTYGFAKPIVRRKGQRWSGFNGARQIPSGTGRLWRWKGTPRIPLISHNCNALPHVCARARCPGRMSRTNACEYALLHSVRQLRERLAMATVSMDKSWVFVRERWDIRRGSYRLLEEDWRSVENAAGI